MAVRKLGAAMAGGEVSPGRAGTKMTAAEKRASLASLKAIVGAPVGVETVKEPAPDPFPKVEGSTEGAVGDVAVGLDRLPRMLFVSKLRVADSNVRRGTKGELDQLAADILAHGLLQNLTGVEAADGVVEIIAGGRRLRAMQLLQKRKLWDADRQAAVIVLDAGETANEAGLAENFNRLALSPADEARAFAEVVAGGASDEDVARRFGVTVRHVRQRLRLAGLAQVVLDALGKGKITLDVAQAFASVPDAERQAKVFAELGKHRLDSAEAVRRAMLRVGYPATRAEALFVGRAEYVANGGSFALDLFADGDTEHWLDDAIVDRLAGQKLADEAAKLKVKFGFDRVLPFLKHGDDAAALDLEPAGHWTDWTQKPEAERSMLVVMASIDGRGVATIAHNKAWYAKGGAPVVVREEPPASSIKPDAVVVVSEEAAVPAAEAEPVLKDLPKTLVDALMMRRRDALALALLDPDAKGEAAALLIFVVLEAMGPHQDHARLGVAIGASYQDRAEPVKGELHWAGDGLDTVLSQARANGLDGSGLDWAWQDHKDVTARFKAFLETEPGQMEVFAQVAIGATLKAWGNEYAREAAPVTTYLGQLLEADSVTRMQWRPTAANFFDRCGKAQCWAFLDHGSGMKDFPGLTDWKKLKKGDLSALCEDLAAGNAGPLMAALKCDEQNLTLRRVSKRFSTWLPAEMMFGVLAK